MVQWWLELHRSATRYRIALLSLSLLELEWDANEMVFSRHRNQLPNEAPKLHRSRKNRPVSCAYVRELHSSCQWVTACSRQVRDIKDVRRSRRRTCRWIKEIVRFNEHSSSQPREVRRSSLKLTREAWIRCGQQGFEPWWPSDGHRRSIPSGNPRYYGLLWNRQLPIGSHKMSHHAS